MSVKIDAADYDRFRAWAKTADKKIAAAQRKRLRAIGKRVGPEIVTEGAEGMPSSGGLQDRLTSARSGLQLLAKGVRLRLGQPGVGLGPINKKGFVRHPVYGHRKAWASTVVESSTWSDAFENRADEVREAVRSELEQILREVAR